MNAINPLAILKAVAGSVLDAVLSGHLTFGDVRKGINAALDEIGKEEGWTDDTVIHFHPRQRHPEHPDPEFRAEGP